MKTTYYKHYLTENLFGEPYPELVDFFTHYSERGKLLDLVCGQGRNAIPLARMGYEVTGIDISGVGISQMNGIAQTEGLNITGIVGNMHEFNEFRDYNFILLDSLFHFAKKDKRKETGLVIKVIGESLAGSVIVFCIQRSGNKTTILNKIIEAFGNSQRIQDIEFIYEHRDFESAHFSKTDYKMIVVKKNT